MISLDQELIVTKQEYDDKKELLEEAMKILNDREKEILKLEDFQKILKL